jgi:hypothetical protein
MFFFVKYFQARIALSETRKEAHSYVFPQDTATLGRN